MKASNVTYLIFNAIPLIEGGHGEEVTVEEIEEHIEAGEIISFLQERFPFEEDGMDLSIFLEAESGKEKMEELTKHLQEVLPAYEGRERRKMAVTKNGLCFLVGLCSEIIQRGEWKEPSY